MNKPIYVTRASLAKKEDFIEYVNKIWDNAWLTNMGMFHEELKEKLKEKLNTKYLRLFTNGHLALELLLQAMELKGEVITTPFSFASTTHAIVRNGLKPVFCDINEEDFTIDVSKIEKLITKDTSAILAVHVYGNLCDAEILEKIAKKHKIKLIFDAAHAFAESYKGKSVANFGDASMFSFHATKVFNTIEGGAVVTKDKDLYERLYLIKNFGIADKESVKYIGGNAKMNEFQAAMGLCNLKYLDEWINKREILAKRYLKNLEDIRGIRLNKYKEDIKYNYAYFPICIDEKVFGAGRNKLYKELASNNIYARKYFYPCINEYECYKDFKFNETPLAKEISERILTLPIYPDLDIDTVDRICEVIYELYNKNI